MNKWIAIGNMGNDPEIKTSQSGKIFATFSLAVKRDFAKEGEEDTDWFKCICFNKKAEFAEKYLHKGSKIAVVGRIQNDNYEKDGVKHYGMKAVIDEIEFAESKKASQGSTENTVDTTGIDDGFVNVPDGINEELPFA